MTIKEPRKIIIEALMKNPEGLTLLSLAEATGLHRHTCTKYVHELIGADIIYQRSVGAAKLCYLKKKIETRTDEKKVLEGLRKKRAGGHQLKLLVAVIVLSFLLSESVIIAYENSSFLNNSNFSNTSPITSTENISNLTAFLNITQEISNTSNNSVEASTNETDFNNSGTVEGTNETFVLDSNETLSNETEALNATETANQSIISNVTSNETLEVNGTDEISNETLFDNITNIIGNLTTNFTLNETSIDTNLDVRLAYSGKITRGGDATIRADLENSGFLARNVVLRWILPDGFSLVSGTMNELCGNLDTGDSCYSEISVSANLSMPVGLNEIKVVVDYEE